MRKKIVGIIILAVCLVVVMYFSRMRVKENKQHINQIFAVARMVRPVSFDNMEKLLVDYTVDNSVKKTIINFLQKTVGQKVDDSSIKQNHEKRMGTIFAQY